MRDIETIIFPTASENVCTPVFVPNRTDLVSAGMQVLFVFDGDTGFGAVTCDDMTSGHVDAGWAVLDQSMFPGLYQLGIPQAVFADTRHCVMRLATRETVPAEIKTWRIEKA